MLRKLLCLVGYHRWKWELNEKGDNVWIDVPNNARCEYCNKCYGKGE